MTPAARRGKLRCAEQTIVLQRFLRFYVLGSAGAPDLIAEGYYRFNPLEFHRFLNDAKASLGEVR